MKKILVYGTLRQGLGNHTYLKDSKFLGYVKLRRHKVFVMELPYLTKTGKKDDYTICEKYEVDDNTFARIEMLEGYPQFYTRKKIRGAWIYYYKPYYSLKENAGEFTSDYVKLEAKRMLEIYETELKINRKELATEHRKDMIRYFEYIKDNIQTILSDIEKNLKQVYDIKEVI